MFSLTTISFSMKTYSCRRGLSQPVITLKGSGCDKKKETLKLCKKSAAL